MDIYDWRKKIDELDEQIVALISKRAEAAKAYLVGLGVDAALLTTESLGNANLPNQDKVEYYLDRRDEFKWKY